MKPTRRLKAWSVLASALLSLSLQAQTVPREFDIPAGDLKAALQAWTAQTGSQIVYRDDDVKGQQTKGVKGQLTADQALAQLLAGTTVSQRTDKSGAILLFPQTAIGGGVQGSESADKDATLTRVVVLGQAVSHLGERNRTGTRTDTDPMELAQSVTTVSRGLIEQSQARNLGEALRGVANLRATETGSGFQIRGMEASLMLNGSLGDGVSMRSQTPINAIESIEVVRGPEAMIGGQQGSYGGVINVITKAPDGRQVREAFLQLSDHQGRILGLDVGGSVNDEKRFNYRLVASAERNGLTAGASNGSRRDYVAPAFAWEQKSTGTALTIEGVYDRNFMAVRPFVVPETLLIDDLPVFRQPQRDVGVTINEDRWSMTLVQKIAKRWSLRWKAGYSSQDTLSLVPNLTPSPTQGWPILATELQRYSVPSKVQDHRVELQGFTSTGDVEHQLLVGFDTTRIRQASNLFEQLRSSDLNVLTGEEVDTTTQMGLPSSIDFGSFRRRDRGVSVQDQWNWGEHWAGLVGYRWVSGNSADDFQSQTYRHGLPTFGLTYRYTPELSVYVNRMAGFRSNAGKLTAAGQMLPDETGRQLELGTKALLLDRSVALTASLFKIQQQNVAEQDLDQVPSLFFKNVPGIRSQGGEIEASGSWRGEVSWRLNASYTDARTTLDDKPVPFQPRTRFGAFGRYNFSGTEKAGAWVSLDYQWSEGVAWLDGRDRIQPARVDITYNLGAGYVAKAWNATLALRNIGNRRLYELGGVTIAQPRGVVATLRYNY